MLEKIPTPMLKMVENRSYYHEDVQMLNRAIEIQKRIQEKIQRLEAGNDRHEVITPKAMDALDFSQIECLIGADPIAPLDDTVQNDGNNMLKFEQSHQKAMQFAKDVLMKAEKEIERTQSIGFEQKKISQSLRDVKKELEGNRKKLDLFQTVVSNAQEEIEKGHVKLASISSEISQIQVKNSLIDEECIHLKNQYTIIHHQQEQIKMGYQKKKKIQEHRSARKSIFDHVKNRIRSVRFFTSAKTDQLKKYSVSIATSFGKNMSYAGSKIDSVMVSIALNAIKYSVKIVLDFTFKVTISMLKNSHPTTLVIIGIFTSCFSCVAIITYPLTSIVLGGIIFVIMKDAAFSSFNNWKNATNPGHQEI